MAILLAPKLFGLLLTLFDGRAAARLRRYHPADFLFAARDPVLGLLCTELSDA